MLSQPLFLPKGNPLLWEMSFKKTKQKQKRLTVERRDNVLRTHSNKTINITEANTCL